MHLFRYKYILFTVYFRCLFENKFLLSAVIIAIICGTMIYLGFINTINILLITYSYIIGVWFGFGFNAYFICKKIIYEDRKNCNDPLTCDEKIAELVFKKYYNNS